MRAMRTVLVLIAVLLLAGCGSTPSPRPSPSLSPSPSGATLALADLEGGLWSVETNRLSVNGCTGGAACGYFERWNGQETCRYNLTYRSGDASGHSFVTDGGGNMSCAWSGWSGTELRVSPVAGGVIRVVPGGRTSSGILLERSVGDPSAGSPTASPGPTRSAGPSTAIGSPLPSGWSADAGPASAAVVAILEGRLAAYDRADFEAAAAYWADDGDMIEYEDELIYTKGHEAIAKRLAGVYGTGVRMEAAGVPLQLGRLVAEPVRFTPAPGVDAYGEGLLVFDVNGDGKIAREWVTYWF